MLTAALIAAAILAAPVDEPDLDGAARCYMGAYAMVDYLDQMAGFGWGDDELRAQYVAIKDAALARMNALNADDLPDEEVMALDARNSEYVDGLDDDQLTAMLTECQSDLGLPPGELTV